MKRLLISLAAALICVSAAARLSVKEPCSDGMVLQQQTSALVWGHSSPGAKISVKASWDNKTVRATADSSGTWRARLQTPEASYTPWTIEVKGEGERMLIRDVLVGEVWLASGQSNMEMPMHGYSSSTVEGAADAIALSVKLVGKMRMFTVKVTESEEILDDVANGTGWKDPLPENTRWMSATAFFFARRLQEVLDVPVGIISFARGGARVESWLPKTVLEAYGDEDLSPETVAARQWGKPYMMYHGMQHPIQGYTAKGFIWYQGCSNVGLHDTFVQRMSDMVALWRKDWGDEDNAMPFYQVEITPYDYSREQGQGGLACLLRAAQLESTKVIPNSAIVITDDLVKPWEYDNIHPSMKEPVGNRLAALALNRDYGFPGIRINYPEALGAKMQADGLVKVSVSGARNGFDRTHMIEGLEVVDAAGSVHKISDIIYDWNGNILVDVRTITDPREVRYCWGDFVPGNLHNIEANPVAPFCCPIEY
ncbi:MAG: sialate O-acetylesterase [Candidatus Cryptobacteroides sp.]